MPSYLNNPDPSYAKNRLLQAGVPAYCWGSFDDRVAAAKLAITQVALTSNTATLTVQLLEGNIPVIATGPPAQNGPYITVMGTQSNSGEFNVSNIAISAVSINATTGAGTISYPLTASNVTATADTGIAWVPATEQCETLANGSSIAFAVPFQPSQLQQGQTVKAVVSFPSLPTTATVILQEAVYNVDSEYTTLATIGSVSGGTQIGSQVTIVTTLARFLRFNASSVSGGTNPSIIAKLLV